jgi:hypothetical protein
MWHSKRWNHLNGKLSLALCAFMGRLIQVVCTFWCSLFSIALSHRSVLLELSETSSSSSPAAHRESKITYQVVVSSVIEWTEKMAVCIWIEYLATAADASQSFAGYTRSTNSCSMQPSGIYVIDSTKLGIYQIKAAVLLSQTAGSDDPTLLSDIAALQFQAGCSRVQILQVPVGSELLLQSEEYDVCGAEQGLLNAHSHNRDVANSVAMAQAQVRDTCSSATQLFA